MTTPKSDRQDALDIEAFEAMCASAPFALYLGRVASELSRAMATCETSDDLDAIYRGQGAVHALRTVMNLPEAMLKKMKEATWKPAEKIPPLRSNKRPYV